MERRWRAWRAVVVAVALNGLIYIPFYFNQMLPRNNPKNETDPVREKTKLDETDDGSEGDDRVC